MAADPEMERLEKQLQQSVDTLSTLLEKKDRRREGGGGGEGDSEDQSEGDLLERKLSGGAPSLTDQVRLLSPGSDHQHQLNMRDISPASTLEESLDSTSNLALSSAAVYTAPTAAVNTNRTSTDTSVPLSSSAFPSSHRVATSTSSSPGAPLTEERVSRQRSHSCDSRQRFGGPGSASPGDKPLMIPSSQPPWLEMVSGERCVC